MDYKKIYNVIIEKRKLNISHGYTEEHHIVPRSLGGSDDKDNLVKLTAKEHFICHLLLTKMYPKGSIEYYKMCHAFLMMLVSSKDHKGQRYITAKKYEHLRVSFSERMSSIQSGSNNNQYGTMWIHNKTLKQCKKISKDSIIEEGWEKGRIINFDNYDKKINVHAKKMQNIQKKKEEKTVINIEKYTEYYKIYNELGFKEFVKITGYDKTQVSLVKCFIKYVKEYKPQMGKQRGT